MTENKRQVQKICFKCPYSYQSDVFGYSHKSNCHRTKTSRIKWKYQYSSWPILRYIAGTTWAPSGMSVHMKLCLYRNCIIGPPLWVSSYPNYDATKQLGILGQSEICQLNMPEFKSLRDNAKIEQLFKDSAAVTLSIVLPGVRASNLAYYFTCVLLTFLL